MRPYRQLRNVILFICFCGPLLAIAQEDSAALQETQREDSANARRQSIIYLRYYAINNQVPYLNVQTKNKTGKDFLPQAGVPVNIYLHNDSSAESLVGRVVTNERGAGAIGLPPGLAAQWKGRTNQTFVARTDATPNFDATSEEIMVHKSKLELDTANEDGVRMLRARLLKNEEGSLVPMRDVDIRLAVKRAGGNLNIGDAESYTTDSTGYVQGEFSRLDLPGDSLGNLELVALVDDNDEVGTLETRFKVPWGVPGKYINKNFNKRSLYATGNKAPVWLMFMAYGCIIAVWSVIIYLITRIVQIKRLGTGVTQKI